MFLAPIGKVDAAKMSKYHCKSCETEFDGPPAVRVEESPNEEVAENLILLERGQYVCKRCDSIIGEYRDLQAKGKIGSARPSG